MKYHKRFKSYILEIPVNRSGDTPSGSYSIDIDSAFTICSISGHKIDLNKIRLWDSNSNNLWNGESVSGRTISRVYNANLRNPHSFLTPKTLPPNTTIYWDFYDDGTTYTPPYVAQVVLHGYDLVPVDDSFLTPEIAINMAVNFRLYSVNATREANQLIREVLRIDKSKYFVITSLVCESTGSFEIELSDTRFSNDWSNARMSSETIFGNSQHQFHLPVPVIFERNTSIFYDIKDTSGAYNEINLGFVGYEVI